MQKMKAVFFDVDGTIYSHRLHDFPQSTKQALLELHKRGYKIGISTSRCRSETKNLPSFFRQFPFDAAFYDGGALVMEKEKVIAKTPIAVASMRKIIHICQEQHMALRYSTFDSDFFIEPCSWRVQDEFFKLYLNMPCVKGYEGEEVFNALAYPSCEEQIQMIKDLQEEVHLVHHSGNTMELTAKGINKSKGIQTMSAHWHIPVEEIVCFGDGENDIQMLQAAGVGIAMGNAKANVKKAADFVCGAIEEDGIYHICKKLNMI